MDKWVGPETLFADITRIDEAWARRIEDHCFDNGYVPFIDYDPDFGCWVFHSLYKIDADTISRKKCSEKFIQPPRFSSRCEKFIEIETIKRLRRQGVFVRSQVWCSVGRADIVTPDAVYEIKEELSPRGLFFAIGQVLMYRQCLNPKARAVIIGRRAGDIEPLITIANQLGVEVEFFHDEEA